MQSPDNLAALTFRPQPLPERNSTPGISIFSFPLSALPDNVPAAEVPQGRPTLAHRFQRWVDRTVPAPVPPGTKETSRPSYPLAPVIPSCTTRLNWVQGVALPGQSRRVTISPPISSRTKHDPLLVTFGLERFPYPPKYLRRHRPGPVHHDRRTTIPGCRTARSRPKTLPLPSGRGSTLRSSLLRRTGWGEGGRSSHTQPKTGVNFCVPGRVQFNSLSPAERVRERHPE